MSAIQITLNGELREIPDTIKVHQLLELFSLPKQLVAIELNNSVVRRTEWQTTDVHDGDKLVLVYFVGRG